MDMLPIETYPLVLLRMDPLHLDFLLDHLHLNLLLIDCLPLNPYPKDLVPNEQFPLASLPLDTLLLGTDNPGINALRPSDPEMAASGLAASYLSFYLIDRMKQQFVCWPNTATSKDHVN